VAPWWAANSKEADNSGLDGLARALQKWSTSRSGRRAGAALGFAKFTATRCWARSVRFTTGAIRVAADGHHVTLSRLGSICTRGSTRTLARRWAAGAAGIVSATVGVAGGRWQCAVEVMVAAKTRPGNAGRSPHRLGVDAGVKDLLVVATSDGVAVAGIAAPKPLIWAQSWLPAARMAPRW
jgi:putative transposase